MTTNMLSATYVLPTMITMSLAHLAKNIFKLLIILTVNSLKYYLHLKLTFKIKCIVNKFIYKFSMIE